MNSKELEDNIKFTGGLVYCGQTTGVSSVGTRIQNPGVQSSPAGGFSWLHYSSQGVLLVFGICETCAAVHQIHPTLSSTGFYLTTRLKEKII